MGLGPLLWVGTCCSGRDLRLVVILGSLDFQVPRFLAKLRIPLDPLLYNELDFIVFFFSFLVLQPIGPLRLQVLDYCIGPFP